MVGRGTAPLSPWGSLEAGERRRLRTTAAAVLALVLVGAFIAACGGQRPPAWSGSVTLQAGETRPWPEQPVVLTATASNELGQYGLEISDRDAAAGPRSLADCHTTTCTATVTSTGQERHRYLASVVCRGQYWPPCAETQAESEEVSVESVTASWPRELTVSQPTVPLGTSAVVTLHTGGDDVGNSPFFLTVFDATTGIRVGACKSGTSCSATVTSYVATTRRYVGYLSNDDPVGPPSKSWWSTRPAAITWTS